MENNSHYVIRIDEPSFGKSDVYLASKVGIEEYDKLVGYIDIDKKYLKIYGEFPCKYLSKLSMAVTCYLNGI